MSIFFSIKTSLSIDIILLIIALDLSVLNVSFIHNRHFLPFRRRPNLTRQSRRICFVAARVMLGRFEVDDHVSMSRRLNIFERVGWVGLDS
jgi:hypothetical protein